jgi:hypothetical protein
MTNYRCHHNAETTSGVNLAKTTAGILAGMCLSAVTVHADILPQPKAPFNPHVYSSWANKPTFTQYSNLFTGQIESHSDNFSLEVSNFYTKLLASQEPLGEKFEKILHENLWDLYEG